MRTPRSYADPSRNRGRVRGMTKAVPPDPLSATQMHRTRDSPGSANTSRAA
jgi:hypothetical protein